MKINRKKKNGNEEEKEEHDQGLSNNRANFICLRNKKNWSV